jgi:hypothetical protein
MGGQINLTLGPVVEAQPQAVCASVLDRLDIQHGGSSCRKLVEGRNGEERLTSLGALPIGEELGPVQFELLEDEGLSSARKLPVNPPVANGDGDLGLAVEGMKVRGRMIAVVDRDGDAEKSRDDGHFSIYRDSMLLYNARR